MKDTVTVKVLTFSQGFNTLPGQAVHKPFGTRLADRGLSHAGIWVESFLLGHLPSHSPSYAAVYLGGRFIFELILIPRYIYSLLKRLREGGYLPSHQVITGGQNLIVQ